MPMTLNVGHSRKVGEPRYSSRGASVNLQIEVEGNLVNEPQRLRESIRKLFADYWRICRCCSGNATATKVLPYRKL